MMHEDTLYTSICHSATLFSKKDGFFKDFAETVTEKAGKKWLDNFGKIQEDERRIQECFNSKKIYDIVHGTLENIQELFRGKSGFLSAQRREEGEALLQKNKPHKALFLFTQSLMKAPQSGSEKSLWVLALWQRSQVLLQLAEFSHCLVDIQLCLKEGLQENLKPEAYLRMAECYIGLKDFIKAKLTLSIIGKLVEKTFSQDVVQMKTWEAKVKTKLEELEFENPADVRNGTDEIKIPVLTKGPHSKFSCASSLLRLDKTDVEGRFFVAQDPIQTGDTLITEDTYASCLLPDKCGTHCYHCFHRLKVPIPCPNCSGVSFCSVECQGKAMKTYHQYECKYLDLMIGAGMSILCFISLRIITQQKIEYFLKLKHNLKNPWFHEYCQLFNLVTHAEKRTGEDLFHRTLMSLFLLQILKKSGYFGPEATLKEDKLSETEIFVGSLLLRHLQFLQFNAHEIYETALKAGEEYCKIHNNYIGVGIYPTTSYFNHDCYPSVCRYFVGNKMILKALRPLCKNEVVGENYGPIFTKKIAPERQRVLLSRYRFQCNCRACIENWPLFDNIDPSVYRIRCQGKGCDKAIVSININEGDSEDNKSVTKDVIKCSSCGYSLKRVALNEMRKLISGLEEKYEEGKKELDKGKIASAVICLSAYSNSMTAICIPPVKNLCLAHEGLRLCWANDGSKFIVT